MHNDFRVRAVVQRESGRYMLSVDNCSITKNILHFDRYIQSPVGERRVQLVQLIMGSRSLTGNEVHRNHQTKQTASQPPNYVYLLLHPHDSRTPSHHFPIAALSSSSSLSGKLLIRAVFPSVAFLAVSNLLFVQPVPAPPTYVTKLKHDMRIIRSLHAAETKW